MAARKLNQLILVTIVVNGMALVLLAVALGTNSWFIAEATDDFILDVALNYGLFKGHKTLTNTNGLQRETDIILTCEGNRCMFSCGTNPGLRKADLKNIIQNGTENDHGIGGYCGTLGSDASRRLPRSLPRAANGEQKFINFALLIFTIVLIGLGIVFIIISGVLALYNTYRAPIHPVLSVFGLYIWNAGAAICILLSMIVWVTVHTTSLAKNPAVSQTLGTSTTVPYRTTKSLLGYSFWMLLPALILSSSNLLILKFRAWKIVKMEEKNVKVMNATLDNGDILLF